MPAKTVDVVAGSWTELTDTNVTSITFQNIGQSFILVKGTVGSSAPANASGAFRYNPGQGEVNVGLADMFLGVPGANRLFAYCDSAGKVVVHHA